VVDLGEVRQLVEALDATEPVGGDRGWSINQKPTP